MKLENMLFMDPISFSGEIVQSVHDHVMIIITLIVMSISYVFFMMFCRSSQIMGERLFQSSEILETVWTVFPVLILVFAAIPSLHSLYILEEEKNPIISVKILGNQWYWTYEFNTGYHINYNSYMIPSSDLGDSDLRNLEVDNNLVLPVGVETRAIITSSDVIHSWAIPPLGVKMDAVPGRINQTVFSISMSGLFYGQCSEICGSLHSFMPICVEAIPLKNWLKWLELSS
uniref:Cytochrome c oxidase subunit 2 n=1 Tax=Bothriometopus macrocnemis TaxID=475769 RepID=A8VU32_9NEOP|nr:cytochrome c oxidase subunit II [Bothriometopus macrocnemis]ABW20543.1 cytochrome c oxidase subunit II [Bothriometopus macrocnemis]UTT72566.1 cytochrome c oxidase subunit 2 [Bothriometopus macrocnemis]